MNEFDVRGRAIAQSFWGELEKIANFRNTLKAGNKARREAKQYARDTGLTWFQRTFGKGERSSTLRTRKSRARELQRKGLDEMKDRASDLRALDQAGELDDIGKKELSNIERAYRRSTRSRSIIPGGAPPAKIDIPGDGKPMPLPKKMAIGAGVGLGTAGTAVGYQRYSDYKKSRGYGGPQRY
tara:strand:- start:593 stop:1141 length:549 start_codon:yes stop_codon:yes gene_type:complete